MVKKFFISSYKYQWFIWIHDPEDDIYLHSSGKVKKFHPFCDSGFRTRQQARDYLKRYKSQLNKKT